MGWVKGEILGHGSFSTVSLAVPGKGSGRILPLMAVKSCGFLQCSSLMKEKLILEELKECPEVIRCFGESFSFENGEKLYNVLLEYASGGDLAGKIRRSRDRRLPEVEVRRYARTLLKGLSFIHETGYVHCDIKLHNILVAENGDVKIADFGLAKRAEEGKGCSSRGELRGTPLYMAPEMVTGGEQGTPADIWAFGCVVAEMLVGAPAWRCSDLAALLMMIGVGEEVPAVPDNLSVDGKDFLNKCFAKDPSKRWTAAMLLNHPFVSTDQYFEDDDSTVTLNDNDGKSASTSPRCPLDFPDWASSTCSIASLPWPEYPSESGEPTSANTPPVRLRGLSTNQTPDWSVPDDWISIR